MKCLIIAAVFILTLLGGCGPPLPVYAPMSSVDSIRTISQRQSTLRRISAECTVLLVDKDGTRASLDGVLIAQWPDRLRIRVWKLGQAVFDLTLIDGETWLLQPRHKRAGTGLDAKNLPTQQLRDAWGLLGDSYFKTAVPIEEYGDLLLTRGNLFGVEGIKCEIDLTTLTPSRFTLPSESDKPAQQLLLSHYLSTDKHVWPGRIELNDQNGALIIRFRNVEINNSIPPTAFTPPRRAKRLP